jgi:hypothetical protein
MITTYCLMWLGQASGRPTDLNPSADNTGAVQSDESKLDSLGTLRFALNDLLKSGSNYNTTNWVKMDATTDGIADTQGHNGVLPCTLAGHSNPVLVGTKGSRTVIWEVACPVHGLHQVRQKTEPIICKIKVQLSPRYVRQCRKRLTSAVLIRKKKTTERSSDRARPRRKRASSPYRHRNSAV